MPADHNTLQRLGLVNGQYFHNYKHKNLHWYLNDRYIGFGDLRTEDVIRIQSKLEKDEKFEGFNEHHRTRFQKRANHVISITFIWIDEPKAERLNDADKAKLLNDFPRDSLW